MTFVRDQYGSFMMSHYMSCRLELLDTAHHASSSRISIYNIHRFSITHLRPLYIKRRDHALYRMVKPSPLLKHLLLARANWVTRAAYNAALQRTLVEIPASSALYTISHEMTSTPSTLYKFIHAQHLLRPDNDVQHAINKKERRTCIGYPP